MDGGVFTEIEEPNFEMIIKPLNSRLKICQRQLTSLAASDACRQIAFLLSCVHAEFPPLLSSGIMSSTEA